MAETKTGKKPKNGPGDDNEKNLVDPIYEKFVKGVIRAIGSTSFYEFFMDSVSRAQNQIQFSNRKMIKMVDLRWVDTIESCLEAFQTIINSPRNVIREEELIVNVANAKKAGPETIKHLAQHSNLVEDFNEQTGYLRPGRLMQRYREDSIGLYENRLVFTTMEYAFGFVKTRYDALLAAMSDEFGAKLKVTSDMNSAAEHVHLDLFLHIKQIDDALTTDDKNAEVFSRISRIYRVLSVLMNSDFASQMSKLPRVKGTINKTNILKKNKNYRKISDLLQFLRLYDDVGYAIKIIEQNPKVDERLERDVYHNILFNYLILKGYLESEEDRAVPKAPKGRQRTLKPKIIKEIIEELTEDYDLPEVEIRKVLIEELTKTDLMKEEAAERRRLVEEQQQRKKAEAARKREEAAAERERIRQQKAEEKERIRLEKLAEEEREKQERMEREIEDRRKSALLIAELERFASGLPDALQAREEAEQKEQQEIQTFADAVAMAEEVEKRRKEEAERKRQQKKEEQERLKQELLLAEERRQEELRRKQKEAEEEEERKLQEQIAKDKEKLAPVIAEMQAFQNGLAGRLTLRMRQEDARRKAEEDRERRRLERAKLRSSSHS